MTKHRKKAFWILSSLSLTMTVPLIMWSIFNPKHFLYISGIGKYDQIGTIYWLASLLIAIGYIYYTFNAVPFVKHMQKELSILKLVGVWAAFTSGFMEEIVFRKMLMDGLMNSGANVFIQVLLSALAFGLVHAFWVLIRRDIKIGLPVIFSTSALGLLLAVLYVASGRNVLPCIVAHILINLVIEPWLILCAVNGQWKKAVPEPDKIV